VEPKVSEGAEKRFMTTTLERLSAHWFRTLDAGGFLARSSL